MKKPVAGALCISLALSGCATSSKDVATSYVSPMQFQSYDCQQLASEAQRIQSRVNQLSGRLDEAANNDKVLMGVGLLLFWPALFAVGGTKQQEAEFARLKGEYEAIQQSAVARRCPGAMGVPIESQHAAAPAPMGTPTVAGSAVPPTQAAEERLKELKRLHDAGLISPEVYAAQQRLVLGN
jgi:hypothetical protein